MSAWVQSQGQAQQTEGDCCSGQQHLLAVRLRLKLDCWAVHCLYVRLQTLTGQAQGLLLTCLAPLGAAGVCQLEACLPLMLPGPAWMFFA